MSDSFLQIMIVVLVVVAAALFYVVWQLKKRLERPQDDQSLKIMMEWMREMKQSTEKTRDTIDQNLSQTTKTINERLDNAAKYIGALSKELGAMAQIGPDIRRLTDTLASPKMRGNFGEEMLEQLLSQVLPTEKYAIQYRFKNGETVDAIVKMGENRMLPIDSKFSMENYRLYQQAQTDDSSESLRKAFLKDVKKRIDEIHKKYILPQEGTLDYALMYVPSEGVFQELLSDADLVDYARGKQVFPVGPNSFYALLQSIMVSFRGQQINEMAHEILRMVNGIKQESDKFGRNLDVLANHVKNASNSMGNVSNEYSKLKSSIHNAASLRLEEGAQKNLDTNSKIE